MSFFNPQNPGIDLGLLTTSEQEFVTNLNELNYSQGDILYHDGSDLTNLGIGAENQVLAVSATGIPEWVTSDSGSSVFVDGTEVSDPDFISSSEIDFSATGSDVTASLIAGSIDETKLDTSTNQSLDATNSAMSTGLVSGGELSINSGDNTKIDIAAGSGYIVDDTVTPATINYVEWSAKTAVTLTDLATEPNTDIAINASGNVVQQRGFTNEELRSNIFLGGVDHAGGTVNNTFSISIPSFGFGTSIRDLSEAIGDLNLSGNTYSANGANLNIDKTSGVVFSYGRNTKNNENDPHTIRPAAQTALSFNYIYRDGSGGTTISSTTTSIDPDSYDDGTGTLATVGNNDFAFHNILYFPNSNNTFIQYGTTTYNTLDEAINGLATTTFPKLPGFTTAIRRGVIIVEKGTTALNNTTNARFFVADKFGSVAGAIGTGADSGGDMLASVYDPAGITEQLLGISATQTVSNKTINLTNNTLTGTLAQFNTALSDGTFATQSDLHDAVTVTDSAEIDFTLTGQDITASLVAGSINETKLDTSTNASLDLADSATQPGDNVSTLTNDAGYITVTGSETLTNKTIDGDNNTISNLAHGAEVDNPSSGVHGVTGSVVGTTDTQTLTNKTLEDPKIETAINEQTGTSYTLVLADASKHVQCTNASAISVTIPTNASVAFPVGTRLMVEQHGAGSVTIAGDTGVDLRVPASLTDGEIGEQYGSRGLLKIATDEWLLI